MAWIDYRKACDMIPHSWILKCLRLFGAAENMVHYREEHGPMAGGVVGKWEHLRDGKCKKRNLPRR